MAKYLYMDGVDDVITVPAFAFTDVELDISVTKKSSFGKYFSTNFTWFQQSSLGPNDQWDTNHINIVLKNGVNQTNLTPFVAMNERHVYRVKFIALRNHVSYIFSNMSGTVAQTGGNVYSIKYYNGTTLVAYYDMNTGTVQDQSGNGRHATLVGGTWMDDGTGGEPQGEDVITTYAMSQRLYKDTAEPYGLNQSIYRDLSDNHPLRNILYADKTVTYPMLQEFFSEGIIRSTNFAIKAQIYADKQQEFSLRQELYEAISDHVALKQVMYADKTFNAELRQVISKQLSQNISTLQRIYDDKQTDYPLLIQMLSDYKVYNQIVEREMFICRELTQDFAIVRTLEKDMRI